MAKKCTLKSVFPYLFLLIFLISVFHSCLAMAAVVRNTTFTSTAQMKQNLGTNDSNTWNPS